MSTSTERRGWVGLESNPDVMLQWAGAVGVDTNKLQIVDVYGLDDDSLAFIPTPIYGFVMLHPTLPGTTHKLPHDHSPDDQALGQSMLYMIQHPTSGDACGAFGLVHVLGNSKSISFQPDSAIGKFFSHIRPLDPSARGTALENDESLINAHANAAQEGQTRPLEVGETNYHYKALVERDGHIVELDGVRGAPLDHGPIEIDLARSAAEVIRRLIARDPSAIDFSLLAVCGV